MPRILVLFLVHNHSNNISKLQLACDAFSGVAARGLFVNVQEHVQRKAMELNFFAPWILTHHVIKGRKSMLLFYHFTLLTCSGMVKEGFGHIVNINSVRGKGGFYDRTVYCSTKFALFGLMDSIRYEVWVQSTCSPMESP